MRVLGIDPGTHTGWAVCGDGGRVVASGAWSFEPEQDKGYGAMFAALRRKLDRARKEHGPFTAVAYELPFMRGPIASRILWGMAAHLQERAAAWRCRVLAVNTMTLKKHATGSGKAQKPQMIHRAMIATMGSGGSQAYRAAVGDKNYRLGAVFKLTPEMAAELMSEHEADAIHVARWARERARACGTT